MTEKINIEQSVIAYVIDARLPLSNSLENISKYKINKILHKCFINFFLFEKRLIPVRTLEKAKITGNFAAESCEVSKSDSVGIGGYNDSESESSDSEIGRAVRHPKKLKVAGMHH